MHDGVELSFKLFLLRLSLLRLCFGIALEELESLLGDILDGLLILSSELVVQLLVITGVLQLEAVVLETVLGCDFLAEFFVFSLVCLSVLDHLLDFGGG